MSCDSESCFRSSLKLKLDSHILSAVWSTIPFVLTPAGLLILFLSFSQSSDSVTDSWGHVFCRASFEYLQSPEKELRQCLLVAVCGNKQKNKNKQVLAALQWRCACDAYVTSHLVGQRYLGFLHSSVTSALNAGGRPASRNTAGNSWILSWVGGPRAGLSASEYRTCRERNHDFSVV